MDIGIHNPLVIGCHRRGQSIEIEMEKGVFGFPLPVELSAGRCIEISDVQVISWPPALSFKAVNQGLRLIAVVGFCVKTICCRETESQLCSILPSQFASLGDGVKDVCAGTGFTRNHGGIRV